MGRRQKQLFVPAMVLLAALWAVPLTLIGSAVAFPSQRTEAGNWTLPVTERPSAETDESWIVFHLAMPEKSSIRDQYIRQEVLAALLRHGVGLSPNVRSCAWKVRRGDVFGDFSVTVSEENSARRLQCLRGAVDYLLNKPIDKADFGSTPKDEAYFTLWGWPAYIYAQPPALLKIYEKYSPLYQILSVEPDDLSGLSFDEFDSWLQVSRERKLISFLGRGALLDALGLPVPDPMVLELVTSLKSQRAPAGILFLDGGPQGVSALLMLILDSRNPKPLDPQIGSRLACNTLKPSRLGVGAVVTTINKVFCDTSFLFGDVWLVITAAKSPDASYQDFCRDVKELPKDADVAALERSSLEGPKGLYVMLPMQCEKQE